MRHEDDGSAIIMPARLLAEIIEHARREAPIESCGLLAGCSGRAAHYYQMTNADQSPEHFSMEPKEQFKAAKDMRARGLELLAICHSHPASPARLSDEDLRLALTPGVSHIVVSLQDAENPYIKGFRVQDGQVSEQAIEIMNEQ